jgi:molybdate transport system substrate-binding protein
VRVAAALLAATLLVAACGSKVTPVDHTSASATITVFAASSLSGVFDRIGADLERSHPGVQVVFDYGSSTDLAAQIQSEGTADVFASASGTAMDALSDDPGVTDRTDFATNRLVLITPPDDPAGISSLQDLTEPGTQVILAAEGVPVGDYAREALTNAGILEQVQPNVVSNEPDDASVVAKIAAGEADAGIVYASDVSDAAGAGVRAVDIPPDLNVVATYPIAVVNGTANPEVAAAFVRFVTGTKGQATLRAYGFGPAPTG